DPTVMLQEEVEDFMAYMSPTEGEHAMRTEVVRRVTESVLQLWPNAAVEIFGSFNTRLYLPSSDIDLVVMDNVIFGSSPMFALRRQLLEDQLCQPHSIEVIDKARVPIIKFTDRLTGFHVDISFNRSNGMDAACIVRDFLKDPCIGRGLYTLLVLLKQFLAQRQLNEVYSGGIGSYALTIMIANFLKSHPQVARGAMRPEDNAGVLFLEFLEFFGKCFTHSNIGVAVTLDYGAWYYRKDERRGGGGGGGGDHLTVQDPQDFDNDVTRGSYRYHAVRTQLARAHTKLVA
ncbi:hypothetical protein CXG81DRAFT_3239, partial [Caulochytrium protostelioides]